MKLNQENLMNTFKGAREQGSSFVFVAIEAEGIKEIIAVPHKSFDAKEKFYAHAYTDELVHVMNSNVRIVGLTHGGGIALMDLV